MSDDAQESGPTSQIETDDDTNTYRELREYARGELDVDHRDVHPIAGLVDDDETAEVLAFMAENYEPTQKDREEGLPRSFWETEFAQKAIRQHATQKATRAVERGNLTQAAFLTGAPSYQSDVSGLHAINQLADWLVHSEQCKLVYMAALMGRGKTDLACTLLEVVHDHFRRLERAVGGEVAIPEPEFAANFHVEADRGAHVEEINTERRLLEWAERGDSSQERWFVFDEASTELTAQSGKNAQKVAETMAPFVKKMRKLGINMIVIGHDKGDVHVAIRSLADFVDKTGLKSASFYAGIQNREPQGHLFDLDGIPPTSWEFDTDDMASWRWIADEQESEESDVGMTEQEFKREVAKRAARVYLATPDSVTLEDVAAAVSNDEDGGVSVSAATVSRYKRQIEADEKTADKTASA